MEAMLCSQFVTLQTGFLATRASLTAASSFADLAVSALDMVRTDSELLKSWVAELSSTVD